MQHLGSSRKELHSSCQALKLPKSRDPTFQILYKCNASTPVGVILQALHLCCFSIMRACEVNLQSHNKMSVPSIRSRHAGHAACMHGVITSAPCSSSRDVH